jgi:hypothetical protein
MNDGDLVKSPDAQVALHPSSLRRMSIYAHSSWFARLAGACPSESRGIFLRGRPEFKAFDTFDESTNDKSKSLYVKKYVP